MTERHQQGYPERDPYRPQNQQHNWQGVQSGSPYGGNPGPHEPLNQYGQRVPESRGGGAKWVVIILLVLAALIGLFLFLNRDDEETADPMPAESSAGATEGAGDSKEPAGDVETLGDALLPPVVEEWELNTLIVPAYLRGSDVINVIDGASAPKELPAQISKAMSDVQEVPFGQCGTFDFEKVENAGFLKDLGASPQACTLQVGETPIIIVNLKGAELADLVSIAKAIDQR